MNLVLKAWAQEDGGPFTKWEVWRENRLIYFRQEGSNRLIGIDYDFTKRITIDPKKVFEALCPPEIVGKPVVTVPETIMGFEGNGTEQLGRWLDRMDRSIINDLAFEKYGERMVIRITPIGKSEVFTGEIKFVNELLDSAIKDLKEYGSIKPRNMTISGYDLDPRPLAQIPEVVAWFKKVQEVHPYLPIFLTPFVLSPYLLSLLDPKVIKTERRANLSAREQAEIDLTAKLLNRNEQGMGEEFRKQFEYETKYSVDPDKINKLGAEIDFAAGIYLCNKGISKPVRDKAIREAFVRINSALES